jgi:hypothetical protein
MSESLVDATYHLRIHELRRTFEADVADMRGQMVAAKQPGEDLNLLRRSIGTLVDGVLARCESAIPGLVEAHALAGDRDSVAIVGRIREHFIDVLLPSLPGASLYESVRGDARAHAQARRARQADLAYFTARKAGLRNSVQNVVIHTLGVSAAAATEVASPTEGLLRRANAVLVELYITTMGPFVTGVAFRHQLRKIIPESRARAELANSLTPELATRSGTNGEDLFRPTLAGLLDGAQHAVTLVNSTLAFLRDKYEREGDFRIYTWDELQSFCAARSAPIAVGREGAIQILDVAGLASGWYGSHWGAPRNLESLVEVRDADQLLERQGRTPDVERAGGRKVPDGTEVCVSSAGAGHANVQVKMPAGSRFIDLGQVPIDGGKVLLPSRFVFLCHAKEDKAQVEDVGQRLTSDGYLTWYDENDLLPGDDWARVIEQQIERCDYFLAFLSSRSLQKTGYVQRELRCALSQRDNRPLGARFIIPILLDDCDVPRELASIHFLRLWEADAYQRLERSLRASR